MIPLAGSFTSETSFKSSEVTAPVNDTSGQHQALSTDKETSECSEFVGLKSEVGCNPGEADRKDSTDLTSPPSDQSSQKFALPNVDKSPKSDPDPGDHAPSGKKRLDSEKQEQEGMEKRDEEKPVNA